jgi:hydrogenase/urease accessory protein HupE
MTKLILISTFMVSASTGAAFAHGDHTGNALQVVAHMLSEPDHLAMLSVAGLAALALYRLSRRSV